MAHPVLYMTSWFMVAFHFAAVFRFDGPLILQWSYLCGPSTSVWNHGTTCNLAMLCDRAMMTVGCMIDVFFASKLVIYQAGLVLFSNVAAIAAYASAKKFFNGDQALAPDSEKVTSPGATACHVVAHITVTCSHCGMLYFLHYNAQATVSSSLASLPKVSSYMRGLTQAAGVLPLAMHFLHVVTTLVSVRRRTNNLLRHALCDILGVASCVILCAA